MSLSRAKPSYVLNRNDPHNDGLSAARAPHPRAIQPGARNAGTACLPASSRDHQIQVLFEALKVLFMLNLLLQDG